MRPISSRLSTLLPLLSVATLAVAGSSSSSLPVDKVYGVNLGGWLILEPWMLPQAWTDMGGEICDVCSDCIGSEYALSKTYPDTADELFEQHWESWFTQDDVDKLVSYGINTVRIPLGFWIIEPLVDRDTEFYPRGGILQLKRGLRSLQNAGIHVLLDHHALPGVAAINQSFAGNCTSDVQFYTDANYKRALEWTAVMTVLSHVDSDFGSVFSIEAINEELQDASQTPGYGTFQKNFVQTVRTVEAILGVVSDDNALTSLESSLLSSITNLVQSTGNITEALLQACGSSSGTVNEAIFDAVPILVEVAEQIGILELISGLSSVSSTPLTTSFMDAGWQSYAGANPADAADGPQFYDNHLYYSFGGVADATEEAYLTSICNLDRVQTDASLGNSPLVFSEWSLATQFGANDAFLTIWADAQKYAYSQGAGWMFWNFHVEESELAGNLSDSWSYFRGIENGMFTTDPSQLNDPNVCEPYISKTTTSSISATSSTNSAVSSITNIVSSITDIVSVSLTSSASAYSSTSSPASDKLARKALPVMYSRDEQRMKKRLAKEMYYAAREESLQF